MTRHQHPGFDGRALYDADFFVWTQRQAAALRAMPRDASIDVDHVAEEIEDLGKRDLREVTSFLARLIEHLLKIKASPGSQDHAHWWSEASHFQSSALDAFTPGMRQQLDVERIWVKGTKAAARFLEKTGTAAQVPSHCPFDLEDLLRGDFDIPAALSKL